MWLFDVSMQHKVFSGYPRWADNYWVHTRVKACATWIAASV